MLAINTTEEGILTVRGTPADALELWQGLRLYYLARRPRRRGLHGLHYPETTIDEASQVAQLISNELGWVRGATGYVTEEARWLRAWDALGANVRGHRGDETYPDNERLWLRDSFRVAIFAASARATPTRDELFAELVRERSAGAP